jgi:hypothetical protein
VVDTDNEPDSDREMDEVKRTMSKLPVPKALLDAMKADSQNPPEED